MGQRKIRRKPKNFHKVIIDTEGITDEQKRSLKFQAAYREMRAQLTAPGFAHVLCCHEAAHVFYFRKAGWKTYEALHARLQYDPIKGDYSGSLASVKIPDPPQATSPDKIEETLSQMASALAAGGVVARKLMPLTAVSSWRMDVTGGDQDDKERFVAICAALSTRLSISIDAETSWTQAKDSVLRDLSEHPDWLSAIEQLAEELRPKLGL
jgi:hypothetical protein